LDGDTKKIKERKKNNKTTQGSQGVVSRNEDVVRSSSGAKQRETSRFSV
jgi:hypothetical protein